VQAVSEKVSDFQGAGPKHDTGKARYSLLPLGTVFEIVKVLEFGAKKYHEGSWKKVPDARRRYKDAIHRHLEAIDQGETIDPESGLHHYAHVGCNALFLLWFALFDPNKEYGI